MHRRALNPADLLAGERSGGRRRRAVRAGAVAVLAASLVWPAAAAQALTAPADLGADSTQAAEPESTGSLSGRVTGSDGAGLEGVTVLVLGGVAGTTATAADGTWTVGDLPAGPHVLRFAVTGTDGEAHYLYWNGTQYGTHAFTWLPDLAAGENRDGLDVRFVDNGATGTVTAGGAPVAGATVGFYRWPSDTSPATTVTTGADGTWEARYLRPDSYAVRVTPPDGSGLAPVWWNHTGSSYGTLFFDGTPRTASGVDVELSAESQLSGRVVDEAGKPVDGVRVALWSGRNRPFVAAYATTAADGTYTFRGLDAEQYTVQVDPTFHWPYAQWIVNAFLGGSLDVGGALWTTVAAQDDAAVADLVLHVGGTVSGTVVAEPGWDGPGISVELLAADGSVVARVHALDDADGPDFETAGAIPAGVYRLRAAMPGDGYWWVGGNSFETARTVDVRPYTAVTDVELVLAPEFVEVPPVPDGSTLTDANRGGLTVAGPVVAGGTATIAGLAPSLGYVWLLSTPQGLGYHEVGADGTIQVTVPAGTPAGAHRLVVTLPGGHLLGWADVAVTAAGSGSGTTTAGGSVAAAPGAPTATAAASARSRSTSGSGVLAATGFDGAWVAGGALAAVLLGAGLVVLRRRSA